MHCCSAARSCKSRINPAHGSTDDTPRHHLHTGDLILTCRGSTPPRTDLYRRWGSPAATGALPSCRYPAQWHDCLGPSQHTGAIDDLSGAHAGTDQSHTWGHPSRKQPECRVRGSIPRMRGAHLTTVQLYRSSSTLDLVIRGTSCINRQPQCAAISPNLLAAHSDIARLLIPFAAFPEASSRHQFPAVSSSTTVPLYSQLAASQAEMS